MFFVASPPSPTPIKVCDHDGNPFQKRSGQNRQQGPAQALSFGAAQVPTAFLGQIWGHAGPTVDGAGRRAGAKIERRWQP